MKKSEIIIGQEYLTNKGTKVKVLRFFVEDCVEARKDFGTNMIVSISNLTPIPQEEKTEKDTKKRRQQKEIANKVKFSSINIKGRGRPKKIKEEIQSVEGQVKRGRGRPKGSKNKSQEVANV